MESLRALTLVEHFLQMQIHRTLQFTATVDIILAPMGQCRREEDKPMAKIFTGWLLLLFSTVRTLVEQIQLIK